jgi:hypothetical protein
MVLYGMAARHYPGGSQIDPHSIGFSWTNNYWCNLLDSRAINGMPNGAKPLATVAMGVLCMSLIIFFWGLPASLSAAQRWKNIIRLCGTGAMICGALMGIFDHDLMTNIASLLGLIAIAGVLHLLWRDRLFGLFWTGMAILLLVALNNLFYYTDSLRVDLPIVQKITFLYVLIWIWMLCLRTWVAARRVGADGSGRW